MSPIPFGHLLKKNEILMHVGIFKLHIRQPAASASDSVPDPFIIEACLLSGLVTKSKIIWMFPRIGVPQNGWFMMENPIKMDDLGGTTIFGNIHMLLLPHITRLNWSPVFLAAAHSGACRCGRSCFGGLRLKISTAKLSS